MRESALRSEALVEHCFSSNAAVLSNESVLYFAEPMDSASEKILFKNISESIFLPFYGDDAMSKHLSDKSPFNF